MKHFDNVIGAAARATLHDDRRIREQISRIVPADALPHVLFCRQAGRQLRVTLDSAVWVPHLRFSERQLLAALAREGMDLRTVSWHVTPARMPTRRPTRQRSPNAGSTKAAQALLSAARSIGDEQLAGPLRRVARHLVATKAEAEDRAEDGAEEER